MLPGVLLDVVFWHPHETVLAPMRVVAVDPGKITGVAVWDHDTFRSYEVPGGLIPATRFVRGLLQPHSVLVFEKFVVSGSSVKKDMTEGYTALYINGAIQVAAADAGATTVEQSPSQRMWALDDFLKAIGWFKSGKDYAGHANDAARHLLTYLSNTRTIPQDLLTKIIDLEIA